MTSFVKTSNYQLIAKAIAFMSENHLQQPDLATVATHVNLSEYYFQRLFTKWAGISPKRFLQYLTVEYAKAKIAETKSLLNLTGDVGLSSPGRLHDLFVTLEAMSPGEFKTGGIGLQIIYGVHESPFGECLIAMTARGICNLRFLDNTCKDVEQLLRLEWSKAEIVQDRQATKEICDRIFAPVVTNQPLVLFVKGTNFQIQVWRGLLRVPFGGLATYQSLANAIGRPTSARAVGNALSNNPVGYLIPCHLLKLIKGKLLSTLFRDSDRSA